MEPYSYNNINEQGCRYGYTHNTMRYTAYSSQDARPEEHLTRDSAAHESVTTVGIVAPKTPAMDWARPYNVRLLIALDSTVMDQLNKPESRWTQLIQSDCNAANISVDNLEHLAADRTAFRQLTCACTFC